MLVFKCIDHYGSFTKGDIYVGGGTSDGVSFSWIVDQFGTNQGSLYIPSEYTIPLYGGIMMGSSNTSSDIEYKLDQIVSAIQGLHLQPTIETTDVNANFSIIANWIEQHESNSEERIEAEVNRRMLKIKEELSKNHRDLDDSLFIMNP